MRRTVLSALALACTAVLAGTVPAFADGASPAPTKRPASAVPSAAEPASTVPSAGASEAPTQAPAESAAPASDAPSEARPVPSTEATRAPSPGQVSRVPKGAPDTGVTADSAQSGSQGALIGTGAAAVLGMGGVAVFVVRRRRATGA